MLQVRLLGQFDVRADGKRVLLQRRAGQSLFAFLILTAGTSHRREKLAGLFWSDMPDESARRNLRQELWRVRKALSTQTPSPAEYFLAEEISITFNPRSEYWLDVAQLEQPTAADDPLGDLLGKLALYQGELLPGFYEDWVLLERERVAAVFEGKMQQLMERLIEEQRWATCQEWAERWLSLGQAVEPAYRALMLAFNAMGDRGKVVATFARCQQALDQELGVPPSPETRALYEQLIRGESVSGIDLTSVQVASARGMVKDEPPAPGVSPFKGLNYFDQADADLFFGRELLTARLVQRLREARFLAVVVGASGSGKSSIVRAGLIPALKKGAPLADGAAPQEGSRDWHFIVMTPTAHPLQALALALTRDSESVTATATLMDDLAKDPRSLYLFLQRQMADSRLQIADSDSPSAIRYSPSAIRHTLLVVDQFEELFTLCRDELEREMFIDNLLTALTPFRTMAVGAESDLTLVLTLRADFYAHLAQYPELREAAAEHQEYIGPMTADELRRAIEEPARLGGWTFETGLVDLYLRDVGDEPGALPLLSHALLETWKRRRGRTLTLKGYAESGGVRGAIAQTAETVYASLSPAQQAIARDIFVRLTELGEATPDGVSATADTRRRASLHELLSDTEHVDDVREALTLLADARLITTAESTAEVAHEALIREWSRLREWLAEDREGLMLHRHLTEAAHEWELLERDAGALYRGARLAQAREWLSAETKRINGLADTRIAGDSAWKRALNELERAFLEASEENAEREAREREEQQKRELENAQKLAATEHQAAQRLSTRNRIITAVGLVAFLLALLAGAFGWQSNQNAVQAETNRDIAAGNAATAQANFTRAEAQRLAAEANVLLKSEGSHELIALLGVRAMNLQYSPQGDTAISGAAGLDYPLQVFASTMLPYTMEYSSDGKYLITGGPDDTAHLWDARTGQELRQFVYPATGENANIVWATFAPDNRFVLLQHIKQDFTSDAGLWDVQTGAEVYKFDQPTFCRHSIFAPDGAHLIMSCNGSIKYWDWHTGQLVRSLEIPAQGDRVRAISNDGQYALSYYLWEGKFTMTFWKIGDAVTKVSEFPISKNVTFFTFTAMALSPDSKYILVGDLDGTTHLVEAASGKELYTLKADNTVLSLDFSPDGKTILVSSQDQLVRLYDRETGQEIHRISLTDYAWTAKFSPDGKHVLTGSDKGPVRVWEIPSHPHLSVFTGHIGIVDSVAFSPDGQLLATGAQDGLRLWNTRTGQLVQHFADAGWVAYGTAFSSDGRYLVSGNLDGTATLWDVAAGRAEQQFSHPFGFQIYDAEFSPDGRSILTAGVVANSLEGSGMFVWDIQTGDKKLQIDTGGTPINQATFSPDGQYIVGAIGNEPVARMWDARTGNLVREFKGHSGWVAGVSFSADGKYLATASNDNTARLWEAQTGQELRQFTGHIEAVFAVAFSPDGKTLLTASLDGTARLWDVKTGQELRRMAGHAAGVENAVFSPDGKFIATASDDGTARLWDMDYHDTIRYLCSRLLRDLSSQERAQYNIPSDGATCLK